RVVMDLVVWPVTLCGEIGTGVSVWFARQCRSWASLCLFFFNDPATTEIYTLSLHDALPIYVRHRKDYATEWACRSPCGGWARSRSEEHTSELQSRSDLVCRLLLEKKKKQNTTAAASTSDVSSPAP